MKKLTALAFTALLLAFSLASLAEGTEVSYGREYSLVTPASAAYPDDGKKLTDGIYGTVPDGGSGYYSSGAYVGFNQIDVDSEGNFVIILDLGRVYTDLSAFTVGYLNETSVGIYAPKSIKIELADERNGSYTELGSVSTAKSTENGLSESHSSTISAEDASGRYVKVTIEHLGEFTDESGAVKTAGWTFIDEISVYSSGNASAGDNGEGNASESVSESTPESTPESLPESAPDTESNTSDDIPQAGDTGGILAFVLLALSSFTMAGALFAHQRKNNGF